MHYSSETTQEINVLMRFAICDGQQGLKVHKEADSSLIRIIATLYEQGLITQQDGGYLTERGRIAVEHAQALLRLLNTKD